MLRERPTERDQGGVEMMEAGEVQAGAQAIAPAAMPPVTTAWNAPGPSASEQAFDGAVDLERSRRRIGEVAASGELEGHAFHGTSSAILDGLGTSDGRLLSSAQLQREGIARKAGEGDAYGSRQADAPQDFVSVGIGHGGMGVALAYAQAALVQKQFNPALYSDAELEAQIAELDYLVANYDALNIQLQDFPNGKVEKFQFAQRLTFLRTEKTRRESLPANDPSRAGAKGAAFPIMFEMDTAGLEAQKFNQLPAGLAFSGDGGISKQVDLKTALRRVYCPAANAADVRARLGEILHGASFEVIPMESLDALPGDTKIEKSRASTVTTLEGLEAGYQRFVHAYADAARDKRTIDQSYIVDRVWNAS